MDREKLANGVMWISMAFLFLFSTAITVWVNFKKDSILLYVLTFVFIACLFFFSYKGINTILDAFFGDKKKDEK